MHSNRMILVGWDNCDFYIFRYFQKIIILHYSLVRFSLKGSSGLFVNVSILLISVFLLQSCGRNKESMQTYVNSYLEIVKDLKNPTRVGIIKKGDEAIITYRKSGFTDIDNAEKAKNSLLEGIALDSISLQHVKTLKSPDPKAEEITKNLMQGINSVILGNVIFASNYSKAKDQNIEERKQTFLNIIPPGRFRAEGLNSMVTSLENMQGYIKENNLNGAKDIAYWYIVFKYDNDSKKGFLKN
jgi:hypothetical protein